MRWLLVILAIALVVLWAIFKFAIMVTSGLIHILLAVAVILFIWGLLRGTSRSSTP